MTKQTMVQSCIRQEIKGEIIHVDWYSGYLKIESVDGKRYSVAKNRISNANYGHRCVAAKSDLVSFFLNAENAVTEVRFLQPPEVEVAEEETSVVVKIVNDMIWGERVIPDCLCPLLLGRAHLFPEIIVGMRIHHTLGVYNNKPVGDNLRVNWNAEANQDSGIMEKQ